MPNESYWCQASQYSSRILASKRVTCYLRIQDESEILSRILLPLKRVVELRQFHEPRSKWMVRPHGECIRNFLYKTNGEVLRLAADYGILVTGCFGKLECRSCNVSSNLTVPTNLLTITTDVMHRVNKSTKVIVVHKMFRINLIYHYGEMVELYSINLSHLLRLQRRQLTNYLYENGHKMFNSGQDCMNFSTLSKDSARAIHNWLNQLEWEGHVPAGAESEETLELMGYVCTSYWGPLCAPSQMANGHPDYEVVDTIVKNGEQTPAEILNQTPADVTVSAEGYFCYLPE